MNKTIFRVLVAFGLLVISQAAAENFKVLHVFTGGAVSLRPDSIHNN